MAAFHNPDDLIRIFNDCFMLSHNTLLHYGESEPYYQPPTKNTPAILYFAHGFYSSALHEIAHWLIAGVERRRLPDYGYWYQPDTRDNATQQRFEAVEARNQALEWILAKAANYPFQPSVDNLNSRVNISRYDFLQKVHAALCLRCKQGLTARATKLIKALSCFYGVEFSLCPDFFAQEYHNLAKRYFLG